MRMLEIHDVACACLMNRVEIMPSTFTYMYLIAFYTVKFKLILFSHITAAV